MPLKVGNTGASQASNQKDKPETKCSACKKGKNINFELVCLGLAAAGLYPGGAHNPVQSMGLQWCSSTAGRITCCARPSNDSETASFGLTLAAQGLCFIST